LDARGAVATAPGLSPISVVPPLRHAATRWFTLGVEHFGYDE